MFSLCLICLLMFACGNLECQHRDANDDSLCDKCGAEYNDGKDIEEHKHLYTEMNTDKAYLALEASCKNAASYYYCCSCGEKGVDTFEVGEPLEHEFSSELSHNATHHYLECGCGEKSEVGEHISSGAATATEDEVCTVCGFVIAQAVGISFKTVAFEGNNGSVTVSNATSSFSFGDEVVSKGGAKFVVSLDSYGMHTVVTKNVPLQEGNNIFYVIETIDGEVTSVYCVTVRRRPMYEVTFATNGGIAVDKQTVEEGFLATEPTAFRVGYTFVGWDYDFSTPITENTVINAEWTPNTNTKYKVEYYLQNIENNGYSKKVDETVELFGTTDSFVSAEKKVFEHFTFYPAIGRTEGNISPDGTLVLQLYYKRNVYSLSNSSSVGSITNAGEYKYGESITVSVTSINLGYEFIGWYADGVSVSASLTYTYLVESDLEARFAVKDEMKIFDFTSTETYCRINGVKDESLTEIRIPSYVTEISSSSFDNCKNLEKITVDYYNEFFKDIDGNLYTANGSVLKRYCAGKKEHSFSIPDGVYEICSNAFAGCRNLKSITLPTSVRYINSTAFAYCNRLVEVVNNSRLNIEVGSDAYGCVGYYAIDVHSGKSELKEFGEYIFYETGSANYLVGYTGSDSKIILPDSYNGTEYEICNYAFLDSEFIESISFGRGVSAIGCHAFEGCRNLTQIVISKQISTIGDFAFYRCYKLLEIINDSQLNIIPGSDSLGYVGYYAKEVHTGNSKIAAQGDYLFYILGSDNYLIGYTGSDTDITLPLNYNGEKYSIYNSAFYNCVSITSVTVPEGITHIADSAFRSCTSLKSVRLPDGITQIGLYAFYGCESLTDINIPEGVTKIRDYAFYGCASLIEISLPDTLTELSNYLFYGCTNLEEISVGNALTLIRSHVFEECTSLVTVNLPASLTMVGWAAFKDCESLLEIAVPHGVTAIYDYAFYGCKSLESITVPDSVTYLGEFTFYECKSLKSVVVPKGVTELDNYLFYNCESLESATIGSGVTLIRSYVFYGCKSLKKIIIPDSVTLIGWASFAACTALESVNIGKGVTTVSGYAFSNCISLKKMIIPSGVTKIAAFAFADCSGLEDLVISDTVNYIGNRAFEGLVNLKRVRFESTEGWVYSNSEDDPYKKAIDKGVLEDASKAVEFLTSYYVYCWERI